MPAERRYPVPGNTAQSRRPGLCGLAVLGLLTASRPRGIRVPAALGAAAVIWGWGVAQYPELLPGTTMTLTDTDTPHATLVAIIWPPAAGALIVGPSYALLFALQGRQATRKQTSPLGQVAEAEETAGPVVFLASPVTIDLNGAAPKAHRGLKALVRARRAPVTDRRTAHEPDLRSSWLPALIGIGRAIAIRYGRVWARAGS